VSRKILWAALAGSVALHAWLLWPRPVTPSAAPTPVMDQPKALVAVRPLPTPSTELAPQAMPEAAPEPRPDAEPAMISAPQPMPEPARVPLAPAPAPELAQAAEPAPASGPAPVHAPQRAQDPVIVGTPPTPPTPSAPSAPTAAGDDEASIPPSETVERQLEDFEQSIQSLEREFPAPSSFSQPLPAVMDPVLAPVRVPAVMPVPTSVPTPAPRPLALPWLSPPATSRTTKASTPVSAAIAAPVPQRPVALRTPSRTAASRAEAPTSAVLRPVQPYRPISTSWRPQSRSGGNAAGPSPVPAVAADRGIAPTTTAPTPGEPVARIAWGDPAEATRVLDQGRMLLVCVNEEFEVVGALERADGTWRRSTSLPALGAYSNRVRVVDHVGGFTDASRLCREGEHLAVVVPIGVERRMERAMRDAATRAGMLWSRTAACYGRLVPTPSGIEFSIDRVEARP
jgi:hypothetical protein